MILLPTARQRIARLPLLFRAHDCLDEQGLFALSYGRKVHAVHSRTGPATAMDQRGRLWRAAGGQPRVAYTRTAAGLLVPSVLLEAGSANLCQYSEDFSGWTAANTPTRVAAAHTASGVTLDLIGDDDAAAVEAYFRAITFTGDGTKAISVHFKAGSSGVAYFGLFDATAATWRHRVTITVTAGVPAITTESGAGERFAVEALAGGVYRLSANATGVVAANTNRFYCYPAGLTAADVGTSYFGGMQAEDSAAPSSYIPRAATAAASRLGDSLYFPFKAAPQAMTVYARLVNGGTFEVNSARLWQLGDSDNGNPRLIALVSGGGSTRRAQGFHNNDVDADVTSTPASAAITTGTVLESRTVLLASGAVQQAVALDAGAETGGSASSAPAAGLPVAWGTDPRFYLSGQASGFNAYTHLALAPGQVSRDELRDLCEVA